MEMFVIVCVASLSSGLPFTVVSVSGSITNALQEYASTALVEY